MRYAILVGGIAAVGLLFWAGSNNEGETSNDEESAQTETLTMAFVGDMMFDRHIRTKAGENGYEPILAAMKKDIEGADVAFGNLEGPITNFASQSIGTEAGGAGNYTFTFAPEAAGALSDAGFDVVSLANNHSMNFGAEGMRQTKEFLDEAGVTGVGNPYFFAETGTTHEVNGYTVGVATYNEFAGDASKRTLDSIKELSEAKTEPIVVLAHWGIEYEKEPRLHDQDLAHQFIDAGADLVVGSHPHVVQKKEVYNGKHIYYSLGNFVFDQYWSDEVACGLMLKTEISGDEWRIEEVPVRLMNDGTTVKGDDCSLDIVSIGSEQEEVAQNE